MEMVFKNMKIEWDENKTIEDNANILGIKYDSAKWLTRKYSLKFKNNRLGVKRKYADKKEIERARYLKYGKLILARQKLRCAVKSGKVVKHPCEVCGNPKSHGHHEDYDKPLEVKWLCFHHHMAIHGRLIKCKKCKNQIERLDGVCVNCAERKEE